MQKSFVQQLVADTATPTATKIARFREHATAQKKAFVDMANSVKREGITTLLERLEKSDFYRGPASTKYHGAHDSGLLIHSLGVATMFSAMVRDFQLEVPPESAVVVGLFHDLCKIGCYEVTENWRKDKNNKWEGYPGYKWIEEAFPYGHGEKSVDMVCRYMTLTPQEKLMIRWHMGPMTTADGNDFYKVTSRFPEIAFFHAADMLHSKAFEPQEIVEPLVGII